MPYIPRLIDPLISDLFTELPALAVTGPRASGKTTSAMRHAKSVVRLDDEGESLAFRADADAALAAAVKPVLLDEWQVVPQVLGAVKRAVDDNPVPSQFLLTGSVRAELTWATWPGTGRVVPIRMYGLTVRELTGGPDVGWFLDNLAAGRLDAFRTPPETPDLRGYVDLALRGGYPEVVNLGTRARTRWLRGYVDQLITRDVASLTGRRDPVLLRRYLEALALNSSGLVESRTLYDSAKINRATAEAYDRLLTSLFIVESIPAWSSNRLSRLVKSAKRYIVDPSLIGALLRLDQRTVLRDGNLLGRLLDTFAMSQIRPGAELSDLGPRLYHLREKEGRHEVDLIAEMAAGDIVAVEIKATSAPRRNDASHLVWLRDLLGDRFLAGAVLHTGPRPFQLDERIFALPICTLWA
jgi:uncharacterized protein